MSNSAEKKLVRDVFNSEKKKREKLHRLYIFSKKIMPLISEDKKIIKERRNLVEKAIKNQFLIREVKQLSSKILKKELVFAEKDFYRVGKIISLTKENIEKEEDVKRDIKDHYNNLSKDSKSVLGNMYMHISGTEVLDKKELELEVKYAVLFSKAIDLMKKKVELLKAQSGLMKHKHLKEALNRISDEEEVNNDLENLLSKILSKEKSEAKISSIKNKKLRSMMPGHTRRNMVIIIMFLAIAASAFIFIPEGSKLTSPEILTKKLDIAGGDVIAFTSKDIEESKNEEYIKKAKNRGYGVEAKTEVFNSLRLLYYYAEDKCNAKPCVLDESAVHALLSGERVKKGALSKYQLSLDNNVLRLTSEKVFSSKLPGSAGTATIHLDNTAWRVSENAGDFEFNRVEGKAWLEVSKLGSFLGGLAKRGDEKISEMPDIRKARFFKYKRDDKESLYGIIYGTDDSQKNGVDLVDEKIKSVNKFPKEEASVALAFS